MKVEFVKEVKRSDVLWRFACGDVSSVLHHFVISFSSILYKFFTSSSSVLPQFLVCYPSVLHHSRWLNLGSHMTTSKLQLWAATCKFPNPVLDERTETLQLPSPKCWHDIQHQHMFECTVNRMFEHANPTTLKKNCRQILRYQIVLYVEWKSGSYYFF